MTDNVSTMNTPEWSAEQALLTALKHAEELDGVVIYMQHKSGLRNTVMSTMDVGELLLAATIVQRRALGCIPGYFRDEHADDSPAS